MRRYCNDSDLVFRRTVIPEDSVCGRRGLLCICLKDLLTLGAFQSGKFMGLEAWVSRVVREKSNRLRYCLISLEKTLIGFELV